MGKRISILVLAILLTFAKARAGIESYIVIPGLRWSGNISVTWDNPSASNLKYRNLVKEAITNTWQKKSGIIFTDWCASSKKKGDIRIRICDENPCTYGLGTEIKGMAGGMQLNFTFVNAQENCREAIEFCIRTMAIHEFGHALGFAHEQNRDDCVTSSCHKDVKLYGTERLWTVNNCDIHSVMNYCNPSYINNGELSEGDIYALQSMYGKPRKAQQSPSYDAPLFLKKKSPDSSSFELVSNVTLDSIRNGDSSFVALVFLSRVNDLIENLDTVVYEYASDDGSMIQKNASAQSDFAIVFKFSTPFAVKAKLILKTGEVEYITKEIDSGIYARQ